MALPEDLERRVAKGESIPVKDQERAEIERQIQEYLSKGGAISRHDITESQFNTQPVKRSRKDQVDWMRKTGNIKPKTD